MIKFYLLTATSMLAMTAPQAAFASDSASAQQGSAGEAVTDDSAIGEIVVTAQRRSETLQRSSLALDVVGAAELEKAGVSQASDLTALVPGLQLGVIGATAQPYIRGVGNASNTGLNDSGVAINVDGIYVGQPFAYGLDFYDLTRVEVLKGPQGTLYGRNATGGAINLIPNNPEDQIGGYVSGEYGNYDNGRLTGALNLPLATDLSARLAFNVVNRDGYYKDGSGDDVQQAGRLRIKYSPDRVTALLNVEYAHAGGVGGGAAVIDASPSLGQKYNLVNAWDGITSPTNFATYVAAVNKNVPQSQDIDAFMINAQVDVDLGGDVTLTLQPAYRNVSALSQGYSPGFRISSGVDWKQYTMEARLAQSTGNWKWVVGAYYFNHEIKGTDYTVDYQLFPVGFFGPLGAANQLSFDSVTKVESYSVFGETTFSLTDQFRIIGGLRYTHDATDGTGTQTFFERPLDVCSALAPCVDPFVASTQANNVSWKVGAEYDVAPKSMLFATVSTGFKAGGVFAGNPPRNTFKPEKLLAFEVGSRNRFMDNRLQVNLEGFYWRYDDKQETIGGFDSCGGPVCPAPQKPGTLNNLTINAKRAEIYGGAADIVFRVTPSTTLHGNAEYAHGSYKNFSYQLPVAPNTGCVQTPPGGPGGLFSVDCSGKPLTRAPRWTVAADVEQIVPLPSGELAFRGGLIHTSSRYLDAHFLGSTRAPGNTQFNADVTYTSEDRRYSVTAYIKNISDVAAPVTGGSMADSATQPYTTPVALQPPRTYGLRARINF